MSELELQGVDDYYDGCIPPGVKVAVEPKLDGWRMKATREGLFTRGGERLDLPHIFDELNIHQAHMGQFLDGELTHPDGFQAIKTAIAEKDERLKFNIFDLTSMLGGDLPYSIRRQELEFFFHTCGFKHVLLVEIMLLTPGTLLTCFHEVCLAAGHEGTVVKLPNRPYGSGKNGSWFRIVPVKTQDCTVIAVNQSNTQPGEVCSLTVEDKNGNFTKATVRDSDDKHEFHDHPKRIIGQVVEVTYKKLFKSGKMHCPIFSGRIRHDKGVGV